MLLYKYLFYNTLFIKYRHATPATPPFLYVYARLLHALLHARPLHARITMQKTRVARVARVAAAINICEIERSAATRPMIDVLLQNGRVAAEKLFICGGIWRLGIGLRGKETLSEDA